MDPAMLGLVVFLVVFVVITSFMLLAGLPVVAAMVAGVAIAAMVASGLVAAMVGG